MLDIGQFTPTSSTSSVALRAATTFGDVADTPAPAVAETFHLSLYNGEGSVYGDHEFCPELNLYLSPEGWAALGPYNVEPDAARARLQVWHTDGFEWGRQLPLGSRIVVDWVRLAVLSERLEPLLERIIKGTISAGPEPKEFKAMNSDAFEAWQAVNDLMDEAWTDPSRMRRTAEYLLPLRGEVLTSTTTDEEITALARRYHWIASRDGVLFDVDVGMLLSRWRDELRAEFKGA